jgi:hypothetical protein
MATTAAVIHPMIGHIHKKLSKHSGVNHLGSAGFSYFYYTNYIHFQYFDKDVKLSNFFPNEDDDFFSLCIQLDISTTHSDEFDFPYTQWGIVVQTVSNCFRFVSMTSNNYLILNWFILDFLTAVIYIHGTTMPAASSIATAKTKSTGVYGCTWKKDVSKVAHHKKVQDLYDL